VLVIGSKRWTEKPPLGIGLNHSLPAGTLGLWLMNEGLGIRNILREEFGAVTGTRTAGVGSRGTMLSHTATTARSDLFAAAIAASIVPTQEITVCLGYEKRDATLRNSGAFGTGSTNAERCGVHLPYTDGKVYWDFGGVVEGTTRLSIAGLTTSDYHTWAFTSGPRGMEIWQDSILRAANSSNPTRTASASAFRLGIHPTGSTSDLANYYWVWIHRSQMPVQVLQDILLDPYNTLCAPKSLSKRFFTPNIVVPGISVFDDVLGTEDISLTLAAQGEIKTHDDDDVVDNADVSVSLALLVVDSNISTDDVQIATATVLLFTSDDIVTTESVAFGTAVIGTSITAADIASITDVASVQLPAVPVGPAVLLIDVPTITESVALAFNPGTPYALDTIDVTDSVTLAFSNLQIDVFDDANTTESWQVFALTLQDTQGGTGGGAPTAVWRPVWLIDMSQITIIPAPYTSAELKFSNVDIEQYPPYNGRILDDPIIDRQLMDTFWGFTQVSTVSFSLANADGYLTNLFTHNLRDQPITIQRYDIASGVTVEALWAKISSVALGDGEIIITAESPALELFEQEIPKKDVNIRDFPWSVGGPDVGKVIPVVFGDAKAVPMVYVYDGVTENIYEYVLAGNLTINALYRNKPDGSLELIETSEYLISTDRYPGNTCVRFPIRQRDFSNNFHQIYADASSSSRNFADAIEEVITNSEWGLNHLVDLISFGDVAQALEDLGLLCDGFLNTKLQAQAVLNSLMIVRGMRLGFNASGLITLAADTAPAVISMQIRDGTGDGERNILKAGKKAIVDSKNAISTYIVNYRLDGTKDTYLSKQTRVVTGIGKEKSLDAPFIWDHVTADKVTDYLAKREFYGQVTCDFEVTQEARRLIEGNLVRVFYTPCGYANDIVEIRQVQKRRESIQVVVVGWDQSIYVYTPGVLPIDTPPGTPPGSPPPAPPPGTGPPPGTWNPPPPPGGTPPGGTPFGSIAIPRPGGLEIPGQRLDQEFVGCDVILHWHANSELFFTSQDEENLTGSTVAGYWVTVIVNDVTVREEFVKIAAYEYTIFKNMTDNPPFGARIITFKIQTQSLTNRLGEPNYITVFNLEEDLTPRWAAVYDDLSVTDSVAFAFGFATGNVFDDNPVTELVDVIIQGRQAIARDYQDVWDYVTVQINACFINVTDYIAEYDVVERIESTGLSIFVAEDIQSDDIAAISSNVITVSDDINLTFNPEGQTFEKVTIVRG